MGSFNANFSNNSDFQATFGNVSGPPIHMDEYEGPYTIIPKMYEQKLETKDKAMTDDVIVDEIPYFEVANKTGTTIIIAS